VRVPLVAAGDRRFIRPWLDEADRDRENREDLCGSGGAEGDRTPDLMSAIHDTEYWRDHVRTLAKAKQRVAAQPSYAHVI